MTENITQLNQESISSQQKLNIWNEFITKTLHMRPPNIYIPIIVPTTKQPYVTTLPNETLDKVLLPISKSLQPEQVYNTLKNLALEWDPITSNNAFHETIGVLGKPFNDFNMN